MVDLDDPIQHHLHLRGGGLVPTHPICDWLTSMNAWKVIWYENSHKYLKNNFDGDSPRASGAIDYAKSLIARGIPVDHVHVVSKRKAFPPTTEMLAKKILGFSWCPYCLKWREFKYSALKLKDMVIPEEYRCPVCTISINDYYVKLYNPILIAHMEAKPVRLGKLDKTLSSKSRRRR